MSLNHQTIKKDFPIFDQPVGGRPYIYLDNAATTHKPRCVIDAITKFYQSEYATVHRGVYELSEKATQNYEQVRSKVAKFIGASSPKEIIFVKGTSEAINLVAASFGQSFSKGDEILVSAMEHHSNIVPWQMLCERSGAVLKVIPMNDRGELIMEEYEKLLSEKTKLVAVNAVSNALGTVNPIAEMCRLAKKVGAKILVDGAQSVAHQKTDVTKWDCDFFAFSSHKIFGPTGAGVLYGKKELLKSMPPWQGGGDMIYQVHFEKTEYAPPPARFEAGTPAIAQVLGMGEAIDYIQSIGLENIEAHEKELLDYGTDAIKKVKHIRLIGEAKHKAAVISFVLDSAHPHDIASILDSEGVAIRAGHHCAQPVMTRFNVPATARASFSIYNSTEDIDALVAALDKVNKIF